MFLLLLLLQQRPGEQNVLAVQRVHAPTGAGSEAAAREESRRLRRRLFMSIEHRAKSSMYFTVLWENPKQNKLASTKRCTRRLILR